MKTIMGTKICKHICAALSLVMLCGVPFAGTAYSAETEHKTQQTDEVKPTSLDVSNDTNKLVEANDLTALKTLGKIDDQLCEILEKAADDELIPVSIWIADIDFEEVEKKVEMEVGLSRNILEKKSDVLRDDFVTSFSARLYSADAVAAVPDDDFVTAFKDYKELNKAEVERFDKDVETYTIKQRKIAKEMFVESNNNFVDTFLSEAQDVCVYEVFPIIDCSITKEKILYLAALNGVESISSNSDKDMIYPDYMIDAMVFSEDEAASVSALSTSYTDTDVANAIKVNLETVNGYYTRDSLGFDGSRIKIGQIESGVPRLTDKQLQNATIDVNGSTHVTDHATLVASILVGKDGMAHGASLSSAPFEGTLSTFRSSVQTLVNDGVDLINMSSRVIYLDDLTYNDADKLADFIVYNYNITWVCAAGNYDDSHPSYYVTSPAAAYNVITIGATDAKNDLYPSNDTIGDYSCYLRACLVSLHLCEKVV